MPRTKRVRTSAKGTPAQSKTALPADIYWGAERDGGTLLVRVGDVVWTVNAEPPSLAWIISAAGGLARWDLLAAAKKRDAAVSRADQIERWRLQEALAENNAQLPKEEQDPDLVVVVGLDDAYSVQRREVEMHNAVSAANDLAGGMEVNYWLHQALLLSREVSLQATYKRLRVIHKLPHFYDAGKPVSQAEWDEAKRDYQDILADAWAAAQEAPQAAAPPALAGSDAKPPGATLPQYVTLDQIAASVNRKKRSMERHVLDMPLPDVKGGGGRPNMWEWTKVRPWLQTHFGVTLPEVFFTYRHNR